MIAEVPRDARPGTIVAYRVRQSSWELLVVGCKHGRVHRTLRNAEACARSVEAEKRADGSRVETTKAPTK